MCGLLGFLSTESKADKFNTEIYQAGELMYHRGPDDPGVWSDQTISFAFNRLSIIDVKHSHQPLEWSNPNINKKYHLVFNGEIYNYLEIREELKENGYKFNTEGDGEAIICAWDFWGPDSLSKLRGMFAFSLWDGNNLILARDQFGIKPLYIANTNKGIIFSSEKKCILDFADSVPEISLDMSVDKDSFQAYTILQYVPEPKSLQNGIQRLESGTYAEINQHGNIATKRYFNPKFASKTKLQPELYPKIAEVLKDSVAKHMRADVTVGSFLSGGIDSTAIATLAKQINPNLLTFTTGFERQGFSEIDVAEETAKAIGSEHIVTVVTPEMFRDVIPEIIWYLDDPVADPSLIPLYYVAKKAREYVKVVLSGEGADELFGGYTIYKEPLSLKSFDYLPNNLRNLSLKLSNKLPEGIKGKSFLERGSLTLEKRYYGNARSFNENQLKEVLKTHNPTLSSSSITAHYYKENSEFDPISRMQYIDFFTWLRGDILVKADKMTMANSLELRVPFLDKEVFKVASKLSIKDKISNGTTKYALRQALNGIVPDHVLNRKKLGFPVPIRHWLRGDELYPWAKKIIQESLTDEYFNKNNVLNMLDQHKKGDQDHSRRIWTILMFMVWHQIFIEKSLVPNINKKQYPVLI